VLLAAGWRAARSPGGLGQDAPCESCAAQGTSRWSNLSLGNTHLMCTLQLDFPRESGIFYHHGEGAAFLSQNPEVIPQARYHWIVELLRHKASSLPRLASVEMVDPPGTIGYWRWQTLKWSPPDEVAALCENSGVVLDVAFSCPVPGSNLDSWKERRCKSRGHLDEWSYSQ
jgi:hypothetical protein